MRIALAQINATVGDIDANSALIVEQYRRAWAEGAALVAFPELAVCGYPPEDLLLRHHFVEACERALGQIARQCTGPMAVIGSPTRVSPARGAADDTEPPVANTAAIVYAGTVRAVYHKMHLPNYAVFDEERYFRPGDSVCVIEWGDARLSVNVCEDIWNPCGPTEHAGIAGGAQLVLNISMSPYHVGKGAEREDMIRRRAADAGVFVAYLNGVGGQDELVFDGHSIVAGPDGSLLARGSQFVEELILVDLDLPGADAYPGEGTCDGACRIETISLPGAAASADPTPPSPSSAASLPVTQGTADRSLLSSEAEVYEALRLGVRDYTRKNGFQRVVIGLSGGIDSALTAAVAVDALGKQAVVGVTMPSRYSSEGTRSDAHEVADNLGIEFLELPIEDIFASYLETLRPAFDGLAPDSAEENIQARIRGNLLMALSNKFGWLVLTTGNKSEMAVGYATLYGDMAGGFAVIKDVPKTMVYALALYRNRLGPGAGPIPWSTIDRAPSAELRPDQTDQDSLPPYELLDQIVEAYVVRDQSVETMVANGLDHAEVERVVRLIDLNEYKRRQAAPGVRITLKAFGKDRRLPITNRYRG
jgi:NAD+ synthase (glutamine-hydrolysing)